MNVKRYDDVRRHVCSGQYKHEYCNIYHIIPYEVLLKKLKNQNVAHPRFVVICKIQANSTLKWWK